MPLRPIMFADTKFVAAGTRLGIRSPTLEDGGEFVSLALESLEFLRPWIDPPASVEGFNTYLRGRQTPTAVGFLLCELNSSRIVGVINVSCIVRGFFQSAYLGYWVGGRFARQGYMSEGMRLLIRYAFDEMKLHRLEANIQPENVASIALARRCGF